jgi:hypothetical protein
LKLKYWYRFGQGGIATLQLLSFLSRLTNPRWSEPARLVIPRNHQPRAIHDPRDWASQWLLQKSPASAPTPPAPRVHSIRSKRPGTRQRRSVPGKEIRGGQQCHIDARRVGIYIQVRCLADERPCRGAFIGQVQPDAALCRVDLSRRELQRGHAVFGA